MKSNSQKPNPSDEPKNSATHKPPAHPLENVFVQIPHDDPLLQMRSGLFELGRNRSILSGAAKPVPEDISSLEEHARSIARDTNWELFDPSENVHDQMHLTEYERLLETRDEIEKGIAHALANVHESELTLANTPKAGTKPKTNIWLAAAFIVAIAVTVSPTFHDFLFFGIPDDLLAWFGSSVCAGCVASMLTLAILSGRRTRWEWVGVAAGIVLGLGLGALRLSSAEGLAEVLFALGLTVVEISAVLLLEWLATGLRASEDEWQAAKCGEDIAVSLRNAELADLQQRQARGKEISNAIGHKVAYVENRSHRNLHLPELEAVAVKAVLDGYNAGIAENVGRLRGATRRIS